MNKKAAWRYGITLLPLLVVGLWVVGVSLYAMTVTARLRALHDMPRRAMPRLIPLDRRAALSSFDLQLSRGGEVPFERVKRRGREELLVDLPQGERPVSYSYFGQTRRGECLERWFAPADRWWVVHSGMLEVRAYAKDGLPRYRVHLPLTGRMLQGPTRWNEDTLVRGVALQIESERHHFDTHRSYSFILDLPRPFGRRWQALSIHACPVLSLRHRRRSLLP